MRSIQSYLRTRLLLGAALVLLAAGVTVYFVVTRSLEAEFDRSLANRVQSLASILFQVKDEVEFEFSDQLMPEYEREESPDYFELRFDDGKLLERSNSLRGRDLDVPIPVAHEPVTWSAPLPDGRLGRYVAQRIEVHHVYPEEGPDRPVAAVVRIVIARGLEELGALQRTVLAYCSVVCLALIGLIATVSWLAVDRGLAPARRLAATLGAIEIDDLPERLDAGELPRELLPMAEKIDALIRRVDAALQRERRTSADIAHELRTPISELLTVSEVALRETRDGRDAQASRRALGTVRDVAARMGRSLATILKLARLESGAEIAESERVDLAGLVREVLRSLAAVARERGVRVENAVADGTTVVGDRDVIWIVASNLLGNAIVHAPAGSVVQCAADVGDDGWRLAVENAAPELEPADLGHLVEPFWRKDGARTDARRSGLGLTLSLALAGRTGMDLRFELDEHVLRAVLSGLATRRAPSSPREDGRAVSERPPLWKAG